MKTGPPGRPDRELVSHLFPYECLYLVAVIIGKYNLYINYGTLPVVYRPDWAPKPVQTGPAPKMVQHAPKINPGDQL